MGRHQFLVGRQEASLPVVAVDDVERLSQPRGQLHGCAGEEDEPLGVVAVGVGPAIERGAVEESLVANQQHPRLRPRRRRRDGIDAGRDRRPPHRHIEGDAGVLQSVLAKHLLVGRHDERHLTAQPGQRPRQRSGHIGQAARFGKGSRLTGHKQHAHNTHTPVFDIQCPQPPHPCRGGRLAPCRQSLPGPHSLPV